MSNPYQPPEAPGSRDLQSVGEPIRYWGGWASLTVLGLLGGATCVAVMMGLSSFLNPLLVIAVFWFATLFVATLMLNGSSHVIGAKVVACLIGMPVAYALYVPVCSFSSMALANTYDVPLGILVPVSAVSFALILLLLSAAIRRHVQKRVNAAQAVANDPQGLTEEYSEPPTAPPS